MKLARGSGANLAFRLSRAEKSLLLEVLKLYPRVPPAHQRVSRSAPPPGLEDQQALLDEALAEQRAENKRKLQALLRDPQRFRQDEKGTLLVLSRSDLEWLLQVLNDIRVGSWVLLGTPEDKVETWRLNAGNAPHLWAMEMSGYFQMGFLEALEGRT